MSETLGREQDCRAIRQDWQAVGGYLYDAMQEVAIDVGGEELAEKVAIAADSDGVLPNPNALQMLEDASMGSAELVMTKMAELQKSAHQRELDAVCRPKLKQFGTLILNIFGNAQRRSLTRQ